MVAPRITAELGSDTRPDIELSLDWADADAQSRKETEQARRKFR